MNLKSLKYLSIFLLLLTFTFMDVKAEGGDNKNTKLQKITGSPVYKRFNINRISTWIKNDGESDINPNGNSGFEYPRRSGKTAVFQSGFLWGGKVDGQIRVGGSVYRQGTVPGKILNSGVPATQLVGEDPDLPNVRNFRVRPDYLTGSVQAEIDDGEGSESEIRAAYERDWMDWPAEDGAPFEDIDGDGIYDPAVDIPGVPGAAQTIWFVANDTDPNQSQFMYGSLPMGIEQQVTVWGYNFAGPLGSMMFRKYKIINKSNTPITDMYVSMWNDPDLGDAADDFVGCDTTLSLAFCYNANPVDQIYGSTPAAVGFDFLQGPIVDGEPTDTAIFNNQYVFGKKNLPMTAHYFFINPDAVYRDPTQGQYQGTLEWYNFLQGRVGTTGDIFPDPNTGGTSVFALYGDPVTGEGWLDGDQHPPGDRRAGMASGPFVMAPGDTQEVVVAEVAAIGANNIASVSLLKAYDAFAQDAYDRFFVLPAPPRIPSVSAVALDQKIVLNWGFDLERVVETEAHNKENFAFQGYNVYQLPSPTATKEEAVRIATFDIIDGVKAVRDRTVDPVSGEEEIVVQQFGGDYGIERSIIIDKNYITNTPLNNGSRYYFAVTAYAVFNKSGDPDPVQVPNNLENPFIVITVVPQSEDPGVTYGGTAGSEIAVVHTTGLADGMPFVYIVDPTAMTGHEYEIFFTERQEIRNEDGDWVQSGSVFRQYSPSNPDTLTGSSVSIAGLYSPQAGVIELSCHYNYVSSDGNWADGITMTFPAGVDVLDAPAFEAGGGLVTPEILNYGDSTVVVMGLIDHQYTEDGIFHGEEDWVIYVSSFDPPETFGWVIFDDGWSGGPVDAMGTTTVEEIGYAERLAKYWNLRDVTANQVKLQNQSVVSGVALYPTRDDLPTGFGANAGQVVDGVEVGVNGSYDAPITIGSLELNGEPLDVYPGGGNMSMIDFTIFGYPDGTASTSLPLYGGAGGTLVVDDLQQDYELRWTGVTGDSTINGNNVIVTKTGGSMATLIGASGYSIANHPLNPSPGSTDPFTIRIPFEVWNVDSDEQINLIIWDRNTGGRQPSDPNFQVWNTVDRMYIWALNTSYSTDVIDPTSQTVADNATWNWSIFRSVFETGDVIKINYDNPFQIGVDTYRFNTTESTYSDDLAKQQLDKINVFPNPYYGVNSQEINKYEKFVTLNHLPDNATIRIFNLAGQLVRTIEKSEAGQYQRWDLLTDSGLPVASGLYVIYIDMPDLGATKILKAAIIQEQQILDRF